MLTYNVNNLDAYDKWVLNLEQQEADEPCDKDCNSDNRCNACPFLEGAD